MKFSRKKIYLIFIFLLFSLFFFAANFCLAEFLKPETQSEIGNQAIKAGESGYDVSGSSDIYGLIQIVINSFLSLIGIIFLILIIYAGYEWMTARGDEERVTKAKDTIQRAIIGVIIVVAAYAISIFIVGELEARTLKSGASAPAVPAVSLRPDHVYA